MAGPALRPFSTRHGNVQLDNALHCVVRAVIPKHFVPSVVYATFRFKFEKKKYIYKLNLKRKSRPNILGEQHFELGLDRAIIGRLKSGR